MKFNYLDHIRSFSSCVDFGVYDDIYRDDDGTEEEDDESEEETGDVSNVYEDISSSEDQACTADTKVNTRSNTNLYIQKWFQYRSFEKKQRFLKIL